MGSVGSLIVKQGLVVCLAFPLYGGNFQQSGVYMLGQGTHRRMTVICHRTNEILEKKTTKRSNFKICCNVSRTVNFVDQLLFTITNPSPFPFLYQVSIKTNYNITLYLPNVFLVC